MTIIQSLLDVLPDQVSRFEPPVGGDGSNTFRFSAGGERLLLKVQRKPETPIGVYFHGRLREAGVPVPDIDYYFSISPTVGCHSI